MTIGAGWNTFELVLHPCDGQVLIKTAVPPGAAFDVELMVEGKAVDKDHYCARVSPRPTIVKGATSCTYEVKLLIQGQAVSSSSFLASPSELGPPLDGMIHCKVYGNTVGEPARVHLLPSKSLRRKTAMISLNDEIRHARCC